MSQTVSPSTSRCYGLARVSRAWSVSRAGVYRFLKGAPSPAIARRRPGPTGPCPDADLADHIRREIEASDFHGEGYRKLWARLRVAGVRSSPRRVRRVMGENRLLEHGDFQLYEAGAITRYVDEAFPGPALQPTAPQLRARTHQVMSILDSYAYRTLVWDIYVERVSVPKDGGVSDERKIRDAIPRAVTCLTALQQIMSAGPFLTGPALTLADLHAAPMFAYFTLAPEAHQLLALYPSLMEWWDRMVTRRSMTSTVYP